MASALGLGKQAIGFMFKNYLLSTFRNLKKNKLFTTLNIFGLATGMACSIFIGLWVQHEQSFDQFNSKGAQIYRLILKISGSEQAVIPPPVLPALKKALPSIKSFARLSALHSTVSVEGKKFDDKNIFYADSNFLEMFDYPLLQGSKARALAHPNSVVLTEVAAKRYFGNQNALGKTLHLDNSTGGNEYIVSGVLENIPENSHLQFDMLIPISFYLISNNDWGNSDTYSYIQLGGQVKAEPSFLANLEKQINAEYVKNDNTHTLVAVRLQALKDIHLWSHFTEDVPGQGNSQYVAIFSFVAIFILLIACINFMNLSTAIAGQRAKEIGLRKTVGAVSRQLIIQFLSESLFIAFIALSLGLVLVWIILPFLPFSGLLPGQLFTAKNILNILGITVLVGLVSGIYPAIFLSSFQPAKVLKGEKIGSQKSFLRNGLVVFQFMISVVLIISTLVVNSQLGFIHNRNIGFQKENLLYVETPQTGDVHNKYQTLKSEMRQASGDFDYTMIEHLPTDMMTGTTDISWKGKDETRQVLFPHFSVDDNSLPTLGIKLLTGRNYLKSSQADQKNYLINETAAKAMGMTAASAVGEKIVLNSNPGLIIGVVKDFNFKPVQQPVEPLIIRFTNRGGFVVVRTNPANIQQILVKLKTSFQNVYPNYPFSYGFVDQDLDKLYHSEKQMSLLFNLFSAISVIISCLGLFGLSTFATQKRLKEIGVRRVLGASVKGITLMLAGDFIKLVALALLIAFPIGWWAMNKWLQNYVYRVELSWWFFALAGLLSICIALLTILYQSLRAALANPVKSLRTE